MARARTPRNLARLALAATAVAAAAAAVPAVASASGDDGDFSIVVENTGDQSNAITLPPVAEVGQTAQNTVSMDMDMGVEGAGMSTELGFGLEMVMTSEVTEVADDGSYAALTTLDSVSVVDLPDGVNEADIPCVGITGLEIDQTFDAAGNTMSMEPVGDDFGSAESLCVDQLASTESQSAVVYPDEPVGPGASWSADIVAENQGMEIPVTYHYTLTEVSDGRFTVEASLDSDFEVDQDGVVGTGNMSGTGTFSGAVANPLDMSSTFGVALEMESDLDGQELSMRVDMNIDMASVVPTS